MFKRPLATALTTAVTTVAATTMATGLAAATAGHGAVHTATADHRATAQATTAEYSDGYFAARLVGRNEVPVKGGPAVGDGDGQAFAVIRISGGRVSYAVRWNGIAAPTAFHIHQGKAGTNGDVKIGFFGEALPGSAQAVTGDVEADAGLLAAIKKNPSGFYLNLHTGEFPGGAVRAQLYRLGRPISPASVLAEGTHASLKTRADGSQEVPTAGKKVGDRDGAAQWLVGIEGTSLHYATVWNNISAPTNGHIHRGERGKNGPVVVDLFADANGLPESVTGIAGTAPVQRDIAKGLLKNPKNWYANLHTTEFDGGAVRGQLGRTHGGW
ncbi:CHRD domain-containing protein [Streptosporangium sp. NPDC051023]|uniref:CHRD domain-containing protein n=1 Tax=Streptosporangium sp. NPDC051023 TaxID=3155410 RepID=UPI00344C1E32